MNRVKLTSLTKSELESVLSAANFSHDQEAIFNELNKDTLYDIGIMTKLGIPERRYYDTKRTTIDKTERILQELGYFHALIHKGNQHKH